MLHQDIKSPDGLGPKKSKKGAFILLSIDKKGGVFKYLKVFQCNEFEIEVKKFLEKHSVDIRRASTKYKDNHTTFLEVFNKEFV